MNGLVPDREGAKAGSLSAFIDNARRKAAVGCRAGFCSRRYLYLVAAKDVKPNMSRLKAYNKDVYISILFIVPGKSIR